MPPTVFVVRPFGQKEEIDFDRVHGELIKPALSELNITGGTVEEFVHAGNIRVDMFEELLLADIVIADISIHNANVYYELGIRHALRRRSTVLIRANRSEVPFDLKTDRYLEYDAENPAETRKKLVGTISQSMKADNADSPVFLLLPSLVPTDPEQLRPVPEGFQEEVNLAQHNTDRPMLAVLSDEAAESRWRMGGLRLVGKAQVELCAWSDAQVSLERLEGKLEDQAKDPQVDLLMATVYDRLGDSATSNAAIQRVLKRGELTMEQKAEAQALLARNTKALWIAAWDRKDPVDQRQTAALRSRLLAEARRAYDEAFLIDQNNYYAGLNSLALIVVTIALAELHPMVWRYLFGDGREADDELNRLLKARDELSAAVKRSLAGATFRHRGNGPDVWLNLSSAELRLLTDDRSNYVAAGYHGLNGPGPRANFAAESAARQIRLYLKLGLFTEKARAALEALNVPEEPPKPPPRSHVIVFSGHEWTRPDAHRPALLPMQCRLPERRSAPRCWNKSSADTTLWSKDWQAGLAAGIFCSTSNVKSWRFRRS